MKSNNNRAADVAEFLMLKAIWQEKTKEANEAFDYAERVGDTPIHEDVGKWNAQFGTALRVAQRKIKERDTAKNNLVECIRTIVRRRGLVTTSAIQIYLGDENIR